MNFNKILIDQVKKYEFLYDIKSPEYRRSQRKEQVWAEIAKVLGTDAKKCKKKWKNMRDTYRRIKQRSTKTNRLWKYTKEMQFLDGVKSTKNPLEINYSINFEEDSVADDDDGEEDWWAGDTSLNVNNPATTIKQNVWPSAIQPSSVENSGVKIEHPVAWPSNGTSSVRQNSEMKSEEQGHVGWATEVTQSFNRKPETNIEDLEAELSPYVDVGPARGSLGKEKIEEKDSTTLLFEALAKKILDSGLTEDQITEIEKGAFSLVFSKIASFKKTK